MARFKRRGFAGLGSAAGGKAVHNIRVMVARYLRDFRVAQETAGTDPVRALAAVTSAKKALLDAESAITTARLARVMVPPEYLDSYKAALKSVSILNDMRHRAASLIEEARQSDPVWHNPRYGSAMPEAGSYPRGSDVDFGTALEGLRRGRRCCPRRRRR